MSGQKIIRVYVGAVEDLDDARARVQTSLKELNARNGERGMIFEMTQPGEETPEDELAVAIYWGGKRLKEVLRMAYGGKMISEGPEIYVFFKEPTAETADAVKAFRDLFEAKYMAPHCHFKPVEATRFRLAVQSLSLVLDTEPLHVQPPWANEKLRLAEKLMKESLELVVQAEADSGAIFSDIGAAIDRISPSSYGFITLGCSSNLLSGIAGAVGGLLAGSNKLRNRKLHLAKAEKKRLEAMRLYGLAVAEAKREMTSCQVPREKEFLDRVDFSAISPKSLTAGVASIIQVVMYETASREKVEELLKTSDEPVKEIRAGENEVARGARIRITLRSPDIDLADCEEEATWDGGYRVFSFGVRLPDGFSAEKVLFVATVYVRDVVVTKLKFAVLCRGRGDPRPKIERMDVHSAFISYAHEDLACVARLVQGMQAARPDLDVFLDVAKLRSGENWEQRLYSEIGERDVLYLCWSRHAKQSEWVDREWRYAFRTKGIAGIEPVPLEPPARCPPPKELACLHFNDWLQYVARPTEEESGAERSGDLKD